ncbi:TonB-dependent receptor [Pseudorhodoferax sp.]|uniref:TonB-dependent receptor n=1 Tax=Pseudorhodoferax sp. TaxID=1993553 RepID=UPI0039E35ED1
MPHTFPRSALAAAVACTTLACWSQTPTSTLQEVTITGNPLGSTDVVAPTTRLEGDELLLRRQGTLGQTLDGLPGVSSTYFGPNASRPVIRGQDGDRIRVLQNSGAMLDASGLSFDHAVPSDPLTVERVEVLRGPGALLYGGSAVGGVVNLIDNRIPRSALFGAAGGVTGAAEAGVSTGDHGRDGALLLEGGNDRYALHADVSSRRTRDVAVPLALPCTQPGHEGEAHRICNSASDTQSGAVGGSVFFDHGYLGASVSDYRSDYGTVAEDAVTIGMRSRRYALQGEWRNLPGWIRGVKFQAAHTRYHHTEFEGDEAGTRFRNTGNDLRLEARHAPLGPLEGVIGLQLDANRFAAEGEEAFAPPSRTRQQALFLVEELPTSWGKWTLGARTERVRVRSDGSSDPDVTRFAAGERRFDPLSLAAGALVKLTPQWQFTANLAHSQRAPRDYELFANGPHLATAAWETGDPGLRKEKSDSLDLGLAWQDGPHKAALNVYTSRFSNYIGLVDTGHTRSVDGTLDPEDADEALADMRYAGVRARFTGAEASGTVRLLGAGGLGRAAGGGQLDLLWRADLVRATNRDSGEPLPRIAPARVGTTLAWTSGPFGAQIGMDHVRAQRRVPSTGQRATDGYTLWNAALSWRMPLGGAELTWFARVDNLTDELAYSAVSVLTTTAFPKAPLPGRSARLGARLTF